MKKIDGLGTTASAAGPAALGLLAVLLVFNFADLSLISPLLDPILSDFHRGTSDVVPLGWVAFVFTALSAVSMIAAGLLADRVSRIRIAFAGALTYGLAGTATLLVPEGPTGYGVFFLARALAGLGVGVIIPAVFALAGDLVAPDRRATSFGILSVAMLAGRMTGFGVGGALSANWRLAYAVIGIVNLALAAALLLLKEPLRGGREPELREALAAGAEYRFRFSRDDLKSLGDARSNVWLVLNFIDVVPGSIILFLIFKYMKDVHNLGPAAVNTALIVVFAAGAAGGLLFGRLGDAWFRRDRRGKALTALLCNAAPILFMVVFLMSRAWAPDGAGIRESFAAPGVALLIATIAAAMFVNQGVNPNWYATLTDINLPESRAAMISLASVMDLAGGAIGPLAGAYLASGWGLRGAMTGALAFWAVSVVLWLPVLKHIRSDLDRSGATLRRRAAFLESGIGPGGGPHG